MSLTRIDPHTYHSLHTTLVAKHVRAGHALSIARTLATEDLQDTFLCDPYLAIIEDQKDHEDERNSDWTR